MSEAISYKSKAVFFDRDGTLIHYVEILTKSSQIRIYKDAFLAIRRLNDLGYICLVITNQPIIEKGIITQKQSDKLNKTIVRKLAQEGAYIKGVYTCPHRYGTNCRCRKPDLGLIRAAVRDFKINLKKSFLIGDTTRDMETGKRAGIKTILVKTGDGGRDTRFFKTKGDRKAKNLKEATKIIESIS